VIALNTEADRETAGLAAADHLTLLRDTAPMLRADTVIADTSVTGRVDGRSRAAIEAATAALGARLVIEDIARRRPDGSSAGTHDPDGFAAVLRAVLGAPVKPLA
jgi:hypothetical protein